jgi:hypothetical protein
MPSPASSFARVDGFSGPGLAAEAAQPEPEIARVDVAIAERLGDVERVTRRREQDGRAHGPEEVHLLLRRRRRPRRDDEAAQAGAPVMGAQAGNPQAVRECVLDHVARADAELPERPGGHVRDRLDVGRRPDRVHRRAGCAGGGVQLAERRRLGDREAAERRMQPLILAQLLLRHHRKGCKVSEGADVAGLCADRLELRPVESGGLDTPFDLATKQLFLERRQLVLPERLDRGLEHPSPGHGQG